MIVIYPSIDKLLTIVDSKYKLVHIAVNRAYQIEDTDYLQMKEKEYKNTKNISRALEEVAAGLIHII
jgi:DNA-directed RNA polymerase subunit omega